MRRAIITRIFDNRDNENCEVGIFNRELYLHC